MKIPRRELQLLVCVVALVAAFVLSGTTWIAIGSKSGYGDLSWVLICAFDAYIVTALIAWWAPSSARSEVFARRSVYGMTLASSVTQGIYHSADVLARHEPAWQAGLALVVGLAIPVVAALTVHSLTLSQAGQDRGDEPAPASVLDAASSQPAQLDESPAALAPLAPQTQRTAVPQAAPAPQPAATEAVPLHSSRPAAPAPQRRSAPANPRGSGVDITIEDVRAGLAAGKSPKQIATQYGCHVATVHRRMRLIPKQRAQSLMRVAR